jgi:hypothetical protein
MRFCIACHQPIDHAWWNPDLDGPCCSSSCVQVMLDAAHGCPPPTTRIPADVKLLDHSSRPIRASEETFANIPADNPLLRLLRQLTPLSSG